MVSFSPVCSDTKVLVCGSLRGDVPRVFDGAFERLAWTEEFKMVEVVVQTVHFTSLFIAFSFGKDVTIGGIEFRSKLTEHGVHSKIKLVVTVPREVRQRVSRRGVELKLGINTLPCGRVIDDRLSGAGRGGIPHPEISVEEDRFDMRIDPFEALPGNLEGTLSSFFRKCGGSFVVRAVAAVAKAFLGCIQHRTEPLFDEKVRKGLVLGVILAGHAKPGVHPKTRYF